MILPESNQIKVGAMSQVFSDMSESYKIFWLKSIIDLLAEGNQQLSFSDIINRMMVNAWYMVSEYHLNLGPSDSLEKIVLYAQSISKLEPCAKEKEILDFLENTDDRVILKGKRVLSLFVPYRLLAPFMPDVRGKFWDNTGNVISRVNSDPDILYHFDNLDGLNRHIIVQDKWIAYLSNNLSIIRGWIDYNLIQYLQRRNPTVPGIASKLCVPVERDLAKAKQFWGAVVEVAPIANIYIESHDQLTRKDISLDHFVPWSFCAHDELWNLVPTTKSINSSKSNNLPNWDVFFPQLCDVEYQSYELIWDNEHVNKAFQQARKQHVNSPDAELKLYQPGISKDTFANNLHDIILPSYQAAKNIGYMEWSGYDK